jgi:Na+/H+-dicarboxylate symporter
MKKIPLHWKIIIGLLAGIVWAVLSTLLGWNKFTLDWIDPFGEIFIRLLKLIAIPLVLFSIIKGVDSMPNLRKLGHVGIKTLILFLITSMLSVVIGLGIANLIKPGEFLDDEVRIDNRLKYEVWTERTGYKPADGKCLICKEENAQRKSEIQAVINRENSEEVKHDVEAAEAIANQKPLQFLIDMVPENIFLSLNDMTLMLQVIFFAIFFGITLVLIPKATAKPMITFVESANEVFLKMVELVMMAAPYFVFALTAGLLGKIAGNDMGKLIEIFKALGGYSLTVVLGLCIMLFGVYPLLMSIMLKRPIFIAFFRAMGPAQLLAFSSSSSAATLPVTMDCVSNRLKVPKYISGFVLPIGATVNMDGTSLYQAVAVVFLAQFHMIDLTTAQQLTITAMAMMASVGAAAVPGAGLIMLIVVLTSVGLNPAWIAIILPVDRILDMCRTVINVTGDATVSYILMGTEKNEPA